MLLTLKVTEYQGLANNANIMAEFENRGGTVGRAGDNDLVLPDPEKITSRKHAEIRFENNRFYVVDTSLSGTYINGSGNPHQQNVTELQDGMKLGIGDYEILVKIDEKNNNDQSKPFEFESLQADFDELTFEQTEPIPETNDRTPEDPFAFGNNHGAADAITGSDTDPFQPGEPSSIEQVTPLNESILPPQVVNASSGSSQIPDDFNYQELFDENLDDGFIREEPALAPAATDESFDLPAHRFDMDFEHSKDSPGEKESSSSIKKTSLRKTPQAKPAKPIPRPQPAKEVESKRNDDVLALKAFLIGAGVSESDFFKDLMVEESMKLIGELFRETITGLMDVLRSRAETKSQFRLAVTTIRTADNNPLKHSASVDDAIEALLNPKHKGFLEPKEAVRRGINDMMNHQMAMTAGIQAALRELIKRFDPETFEDRFREGFVFQKKAKCWDAYIKAYPGLSSRTLEEFFGEAFVHAYEAQMQALKSINE